MILAITKVRIYHNPRCSKSRETLQLLKEKGIEPEVVLYLDTPPTEAELRRILGMLGLSARELMRKKEQPYMDLGLDRDSLTEKELIRAMVENPVLIERPIVIKGGKAALGRPPEKVLGVVMNDE